MWCVRMITVWTVALGKSIETQLLAKVVQQQSNGLTKPVPLSQQSMFDAGLAFHQKYVW